MLTSMQSLRYTILTSYFAGHSHPYRLMLVCFVGKLAPYPQHRFPFTYLPLFRGRRGCMTKSQGRHSISWFEKGKALLNLAWRKSNNNRSDGIVTQMKHILLRMKLRCVNAVWSPSSLRTAFYWVRRQDLSFPTLLNIDFELPVLSLLQWRASSIYDKPPQIAGFADYPYCIYLNLLWFILSFE